MKKVKIVSLFMVMTLLLSGCGIKSAIKKMSEAIVDLSEKAGDLIEDINDVVYLVDSKIENNEISNEMGKLLDNQLSQVIESLEGLLENGGGYLFGELNGTIDNAFTNISMILDQIEEGIIDEALPALIDQISGQLQMQVNSIVLAAEDMLMYTFGNLHVFMDKTVNSLVILISAILLAVGLIVFVILLLRKYFKFQGSRLVGLIFMCIYMAFFLVVILFPRVRANIIVGFDYGKEIALQEIPPKITGVLPETFVLGKNQRIYIYGRHLDKMKNISIKLMQGSTEKFSIPEECIIVATGNRIVLSNFESKLNWIYPQFEVFKTALKANVSLNTVAESAFREYANSANEIMYQAGDLHLNAVLSPMSIQPALSESAMAHVLEAQPVSLATTRVDLEKLTSTRTEAAVSAFGNIKATEFITAELAYFKQIYKLPEGDYGLHVFDSLAIESPQFISIVNPPPPPPKPDIQPIAINWSGGLNATENEQVTLDVTFALKNPEEINYPFRAQITTTPASTPINLTVDEGYIAAASSGGQAKVRTRNFDLNDAGNYTFQVRSDIDNRIDEANEANNTFSTVLRVDEQLYQVIMSDFKLKARSSLASMGEMRARIKVSVTGQSEYNCSSDASGSGATKNLNCSKTFNGVKPGQVVMLSAEVFVKVNFPFISDMEFAIGTFNWNSSLSANPTGTSTTKEESIGRQNDHVEFQGRMIINKL